jgi:hypothetical protein
VSQKKFSVCISIQPSQEDIRTKKNQWK